MWPTLFEPLLLEQNSPTCHLSSSGSRQKRQAEYNKLPAPAKKTHSMGSKAGTGKKLDPKYMTCETRQQGKAVVPISTRPHL